MKDSVLNIPAFTAYVEPDFDKGAEISESDGVTRWRRGQKLTWFGKLSHRGPLTVSLEGATTRPVRLRMVVQPVAGGKPVRRDTELKNGTASFGAFSVSPGYVKLSLEVVKGDAPSIRTLVLAGDGAVGARFNLKERRNAASVHLGYPTENKSKIVAFYNEVTATEDPLHTYYMACGFGRGYFGIQVNSPTERRIIFSIWDSGNEAVDRTKVADDDRVKLLEKGSGVFTDDFGNEGTGGHSHLVYPWKKGQTLPLLCHRPARREEDPHRVRRVVLVPGDEKMGAYRPVPRPERRRLSLWPL